MANQKMFKILALDGGGINTMTKEINKTFTSTFASIEIPNLTSTLEGLRHMHSQIRKITESTLVFREGLSRIYSQIRKITESTLVFREGLSRIYSQIPKITESTLVFREGLSRRQPFTHIIDNSNALDEQRAREYINGGTAYDDDKARAYNSRGDAHNSIKIHSDISEHVESFLNSGHNCSAVEEAYKIVREKLKDITGEEQAHKAFCEKNYKKIFGHDPRDEKNFFEGVKFLHMAIQKFRNEKAHTPAKAMDRNTAFHWIVLASLAYKLIGPRNNDVANNEKSTHTHDQCCGKSIPLRH